MSYHLLFCVPFFEKGRYNFVLFMSSLTDWAMTRWKTLNFKTIKHEEEITGFFILVSGDM